MFYLIFDIYAYICLCLFLIGFSYKTISSFKTSNKYDFENSTSTTFNMGVFTLIFVHFFAYIIAREIFIWMKIDSNLKNIMPNIISGTITTIIFTYIFVLFLKKYMKNKLSLKGNLAETIMSIIIVAHIFLGFLATYISTNFEKNLEKKTCHQGILHYNN